MFVKLLQNGCCVCFAAHTVRKLFHEMCAIIKTFLSDILDRFYCDADIDSTEYVFAVRH